MRESIDIIKKMSRDEYEILLLEIRQELKDKEEILRNLSCVNLFLFKRVQVLSKEVQKQILDYRIDRVRNKEFLNLMEG